MTERVSWLALGALFCAALLLRCIGIDHLPGINGDEAFYGVDAVQWLHGHAISLRTGTGLPMNAPFFGTVLLLHLLFPTSLITLRAAAVLHSVLACSLAFGLFRKQGTHFAAMLAASIAVLPIHLGYARMAWDTAAVPTMMVIALAGAVQLRPVWTAIAFAFCLWVHPTTVFSLPILLAPFAIAKWPRSVDGGLRRPALRWVALGTALVALGIGGLVALVACHALPDQVLMALTPQRMAEVLQRLTSPAGAVEFVTHYAELISGPTVYRYIAGSVTDVTAWLHVVGFFVITLVLTVLAGRGWVASRRFVELAVLAGLLLTIVAAYLIGGPPILNPSTSRYGIFLTIPTCVVVTMCVDSLAQSQRAKALTRFAAALVGALLLVSFNVNFLSALHHADPHRENTFRTGDTDPKALALQEIVRMRTPGHTAVVFAEDWWIYWTVRYLAAREDDVRVKIVGMDWDYRFPRDFVPPPYSPASMDLFGVAWAGGAFDDYLARKSSAVREVRGYEPGPILRVHRWRSPATTTGGR